MSDMGGVGQGEGQVGGDAVSTRNDGPADTGDHDNVGGPSWVKPRRRLPFRPRLLLAVVAALALVLGLLAVWVNGDVNPGSPGPAVTVNLPAGSSYSAAADVLARDGVIGHPTWFRLYARVQGAGTVQAGSYVLHKHESYGDVVAALGRGPTADRLTVPEGSTLAQVAAMVGRIPGHTAAGFLAAANSGQVRSDLEPPGTTNLEGLVAPATYNVVPGDSDLSIVGQMVTAFDEQASSTGFAQAAARLGVTPYQAVIVASIIQREAKLPQDQGRVARVVYNRLGKNMPLQLDTSVIYALGGNVTTLTPQDFNVASPYNTYRVTGLPPTPIATPGQAALAAAVNPVPGPWLYFVVVSPDGGEAFGTTLAEQNANIALAHQRGLG